MGAYQHRRFPLPAGWRARSRRVPWPGYRHRIHNVYRDL